MIIALDFDGTYTEDPNFWDQVIRAAKIHGHTVIIATMRYDNEEEGSIVRETFSGKVDQIIFTERKAKLVHLHEIGVKPHIWIDDNPVWLFQNG